VVLQQQQRNSERALPPIWSARTTAKQFQLFSRNDPDCEPDRVVFVISRLKLAWSLSATFQPNHELVLLLAARSPFVFLLSKALVADPAHCQGRGFLEISAFETTPKTDFLTETIDTEDRYSLLRCRRPAHTHTRTHLDLHIRAYPVARRSQADDEEAFDLS